MCLSGERYNLYNLTIPYLPLSLYYAAKGNHKDFMDIYGLIFMVDLMGCCEHLVSNIITWPACLVLILPAYTFKMYLINHLKSQDVGHFLRCPPKQHKRAHILIAPNCRIYMQINYIILKIIFSELCIV